MRIIDQRLLPHQLCFVTLNSVDDVVAAIRSMQVRGAPLIGITAAFGLALALRVDPSDQALQHAAALLSETRPTAVNLRWAIDEVIGAVSSYPYSVRADAAYECASRLLAADEVTNRAIGEHGLRLLREAARDGRVNVLTHCNAGWLATSEWGTALAPIYLAHDAGIEVHVWVDETRPRNQGASLTAWELAQRGVPHTLIADNAGGHLMQRGAVELCIVGADRVARNGDVANKIGTYMKAVAARDCGVPFYVAVPSATIDWSLPNGSAIPIEERSADEVLYVQGALGTDEIVSVRVAPEGTVALNPAFDVTPARLITGLLTERGECAASEAGLLGLFPERQ